MKLTPSRLLSLRLLVVFTVGCVSLVLPAGNAVAAGPDLPAACTAGSPNGDANGFTLEQARACAPGAPVVAAGSPLTRDGTFIVSKPKGYQVVTRSSKPDTADRKLGDPCVEGQVRVIDGGGIIEWLAAELCYNYSVAWAYNVQASCTVILLGFWCLGNYHGTFGNYTGLAGAWGNFYNQAGPFPMNTGVRLDVKPNGSWWAWSYDCGTTC
jgi:hypothetical protein